MLPDVVGALMIALYGLGTALPVPDIRDVTSWQDAAALALPAAAFRSVDRAVTNWRQQAALQLDLPPAEAAQTFAGSEPHGASRCVRLNNYWCIKRAGWSGEIAADSEGHVAFATALDGATVAALLLRRYYVAYGRHSALAIVSRWAPAAQCGGVLAAGIPRRAARAPRLAPVARKGLGNTLRARFLAGHTRGGLRLAGRGGPSMRRTVIADRSLSMMAAPEIAVGMGERLTIVEPRRTGAKLADVSSLTTAAPSAPLAAPAAPVCADDGQRIRNYAARAIEGVASGIDDDLKLFDADGTPGPNLVRLMRNMAGVEIGPLAVRAGLVAAAIDRMQRQLPPVRPGEPQAPPAGG